MKKCIQLLIGGFLILSINSCTKDAEPHSEFQDIQGKIFVEIQDYYENGKFSDAKYDVVLIEDGTEKSYPIDFTTEELSNYISNSGKQVKMEAKRDGERLRPIKMKYEEISSKSPGGGNGGDPAEASILAVKVSDATSSPSWSNEFIECQLLGLGCTSGIDPLRSTANLYTESSRGDFTIGSLSFAEATIDTIECFTYNLRSAVYPVLAAQGINTTDYDFIMFVTAPVCGYGGAAAINSNFFHNNYIAQPHITPHELGHCLGMNHSARLNPDGSTSTYGDPSCFMAIGMEELNAPHRIGKGWIANKNIKTANRSGTITITPLEIDRINSKQVIIVKKELVNFPSNSTQDYYYYLSYRAPLGPFDEQLNTSVANKLNIHIWDGKLNSWTRYVDALDEGETYIDELNGLQFTNQGIVNEEMTVSVEFL